MYKRALVVTPLRLHRFEENVHGAYQRLRVLLEAVSVVATEVDLMSLVSIDDRNDPDQEEVARRELKRFWGVDCRVVLGDYRWRNPVWPWFVEQFRRIFSYRFSQDFSAFNNDLNVRRLAMLMQDEPDLIVAHKLPSCEMLRIRPNADIPVVFDLDDIEHIALKRHAALQPARRERFAMYATVPAVKAAVKRSVRNSARSLVCSPRDQGYLVGEFGVTRETIVVVPNSCELRDKVEIAQNSVVLFVGTYAWHPNAQAAEFFLRHCWREIRASVPDAQLHFVGANPELIPSFSDEPDGVRFTGFVPDIGAVYRNSRIVICPILSGGGTRVKLVEAAAYGLPIVSTTIGAEGLGFEDGTHALLKDSADSFVRACVDLLTDERACSRLADAAYEHAKTHFDRRAVVDELKDELLRVLGELS